MGNLMGIVMLVFTINAFLIIAHVNGAPNIGNVGVTAVSKIFSIDTEKGQFGFNENATGFIPKNAETNTFESSQSTFNFVDAIKIGFNMLGIIMSLLIAPINIAFVLGFPFLLNFLIFGPMTLMFYVAILIWFRGGGG